MGKCLSCEVLGMQLMNMSGREAVVDTRHDVISQKGSTKQKGEERIYSSRHVSFAQTPAVDSIRPLHKLTCYKWFESQKQGISPEFHSRLFFLGFLGSVRCTRLVIVHKLNTPPVLCGFCRFRA